MNDIWALSSCLNDRSCAFIRHIYSYPVPEGLHSEILVFPITQGASTAAVYGYNAAVEALCFFRGSCTKSENIVCGNQILQASEGPPDRKDPKTQIFY